MRIEPLRSAAREARNRAREEFIKLLTEDAELNHESTWTNYREKLQEMEKDGKLPSSLSELGTDEKERLFKDHVKQFHREPPASHGDDVNGDPKDSEQSDDDGNNERYHMCAEGFTAIERESMFSEHIESMLEKIGEEFEVAESMT
eukprot:767869-Hanusia_phi.AAC.2